MRKVNDISGMIVDAAIQVHSALGPGLLESAYEACLTSELRERGLAVQTQVMVPLVYKTIELEAGYRADLVVEDLVLVEIKTLARILPVHEAQVLTYLRLLRRPLGLLLNFYVPLMRDGIKRIINRL